MRTPQAYAPAIFSVIVFILMRFRFDPLSRAFSNRFIFDENGKPKRIEMYAFSKRKGISVDRAFVNVNI